jgi:hypothetical protein
MSRRTRLALLAMIPPPKIDSTLTIGFRGKCIFLTAKRSTAFYLPIKTHREHDKDRIPLAFDLELDMALFWIVCALKLVRARQKVLHHR